MFGAKEAPHMTIAQAYYAAIVTANSTPTSPGSFNMIRDMPTIREQSNLVAKKFPINYNGCCLMVQFPDNSYLIWDMEQGFAHPGN